MAILYMMKISICRFIQQKMETIQYNEASAIIGVIRCSSRENLYQELGIETPQQRRWYRKLCCF